jgi:hypothetical protein
VQERRGALEIALANGTKNNDDDGRHLVWRVRLVELLDNEILVEPPATLGKVIRLDAGIELIAMLAVGQNRWMFHTTNRGLVQHAGRDRRPAMVMRLTMPQSVERCRRNYYRMPTASLNLPEVEVWPLLDPKSVVLAERANELQFASDKGRTPDDGGPDGADEPTMPEVGPKFTATLLNIGGGGVGLRVRPQDAQALARHKLFWLRFSLPPQLTTPVCATGKLAHTNVDSSQHTYAGMAFDFSFNPGHQQLVVEQITHYINTMQKQAA